VRRMANEDRNRWGVGIDYTKWTEVVVYNKS
jgi:hypothetical protein